MEFPEDVLTIIRQYARPRMKFIHEYNHLVRLIGVEWYAVKRKLEGPDAERVLEQFADYVDSVVMTRSAKEAVPVLAQECAVSDYMKWLVASRHYSAHLDVTQLRLQRLEYLIK
jgi:hypothetical protein